MIYRLYKAGISDVANAATTVNTSPQVSFVFDLANTDYQQFKTDILSGSELKDADGNVMTQEEAEAFVQTLP